MRPCRLEMVNFGPFRHEVVSFTELNHDHVFLISGDTGAGKSTIFDAMTLALFNTTSGVRDPKEMRSTFAGQEGDLTAVVFTFEHHGVTYRISREIEQWRKGRKTPYAATVDFAIIDGVGGKELKNLGTKHGDVGAAVYEILGMNADQFKQIIMLPQNEFRKFLLASTKDKLDILKQIFGTRLFEQFQRRVKQTFDAAKETQQALDAFLLGAYQSHVWPESVRQAFEAAPEHQRYDIAITYQKTIATEAALAKTQYTSLDQAYQTLQKERMEAQKISDAFESYDTLQKTYHEAIESKQETMDAQRILQTQLRWVQPLVPVVEQHSKETQALEVSSCEFQRIEAALKEVSIQQETLRQEESAYQKQAQEIVALKTSQGAWQTALIYARQKEALLKHIEINQTTYEKQSTELQKFVDDALQLKEQMAAFGDFEAWLKAIQDQDMLYHTCTEARASLELLDHKHHHAKASLQDVSDAYQHKARQLIEIQDRLKAQTDTLETLVHDRQLLMIAQLRQDLKDGEPCVICGALEHPGIESHREADEAALLASFEKIDLQRQAVASLKGQLESLERDLKDEHKRLELLQINSSEAKQHVSEAFEVFKSEFGDVLSYSLESYDSDVVDQCMRAFEKERQANKEHYDAQMQAFKQTEKTLERIQDAITTMKTKLAAISGSLNSDKQSCADIDAKVSGLKEPSYYEAKLESASLTIAAYEATGKELQSRLVEITKTATSLQTQWEQVSAQIKQSHDVLATAKETLDAALTEKDVDLDALVTLWHKGTLEALNEQLYAFDSHKQRLHQDIEAARDFLKDQTMPDMAQFIEKETRMKQQTQESLAAKARLDSHLQQVQDTMDSIDGALQTQASNRTQYQEISDLWATINGSVQGKLKLETYVVQTYLRQVLDYANLHYFSQLTNGRYQFKLSDPATSGRSDSGLDIDVLDLITGTTRATKTLSGGETFIAALSIALSLSEVVQNTSNGIAIEALFIDEGFGALDKDTLDQAMEALERIGASKMVGVISHVDAMKARIGQQLLITKQGDGSSIITYQTKE